MPPLTMQKKRLLQDLVDGLVVEGDLKKKDAEEFVRHFFKVIEEGLLADQLVKVNGLGVFKLIEVEARSSVDVNTGEPFLIKEHLKLSFIPDTALKDKVNKPFESYEPVQTASSNEPSDTLPSDTMPSDTLSSEDEESSDPNPSSFIPSEPINMKETIPDNHTDTPSVNEEPQAPTAPQKPLDLGLDEEDPFEPKEGEERQPTIQEMLAALKEENERQTPSESGKRGRSIVVIILIALGLLFLAGLIYWSMESNRKARQERALKEAMMEQLAVEVDPLTGQPTQDALDSLSILAAQENAATVKQPTQPSTTKPVVKPAPKPATSTAKPATTTTKPVATTPKAVSTATKPTTTASKPATTTPKTTTSTTTKTTSRPSEVTVKAGDRLTLLSEKYYGHKVFWVYIYLENKAKIADPNNVTAGTTIVLPKAHPTMMDPTNAEAVKKAEGIQQRILAQF